MRKIIYAAILLLQQTITNAQEPADALRMSWINLSGSARQQAIGGAMASLGGDLSAAFVNPAGIAFYKTGDLIITPQFNRQKKSINLPWKNRKS